MAPGVPVSCADLGALHPPALVIPGGRSFAAQGMISEHVANFLDNALLFTIEGASHDGPLTSQAEVEGHILSFLDLVD